MNWLGFLSAGLALLAADAGLAAERIARFGPDKAAAELVVWGATDLEELRPAIEGFLAQRPNVSIVYHDMQSTVLYQQIRSGQPNAPDMVISSAADLQIKLANDGFARDHKLAKSVSLPAWASWRNQVFGISVEPAVIVLHQSLSRLGPMPRSRPDLIHLLAKHFTELEGRVATYDLDQSGLGYLFASHDSLYSTNYTTLTQILGRAHARLFCCTGDMLDAIEKETVLVGYNLLGSYALARKQRGAPIEIVLPADYTLVLSRTALIPRTAKRPDLSGAFLDYLLSPESQKRFGTLDRYGATTLTATHPIVLNPSLLLYLDPVKRTKFIKTWRELIGDKAR
jgi:ABC-type Fe3+ transport system substrate-binding protein